MRRWGSVVAALAVVLVGCSDSDPVRRAVAPPLGRFVGTAVALLTPYDSCGELLDDVRREAAALVGPYGVPGPDLMAGRVLEDTVAMPAGGTTASRSSGAPAPAHGGAEPSFSGTNVQEAGIDEPDLVKTDGRLVVTVAGDRLRVVDVAGGGPVARGTLALPQSWDAQLLLAGDRVLVFSTAFGERDGRPATKVTVVDLADPDRPAVAATLELEGAFVSARLIDGVARVVLRSGPDLVWHQPVPQAVGGGPEDAYVAAERLATDRNRDLVARSTVGDWLPDYRLEAAGGAEETGTLVPCEGVSRPTEPSGVGMLSVLSVDPADPRPGEAVSVVAAGETVYASGENLYVATHRWIPTAVTLPEGSPMPAPEPVTTQIHQFDVRDPDRARYVGSGEVPGWLLDQFSMDEHDGFLRVATTEDAVGPMPVEGPASASAVTVLAPRDGALVRVGRVGDLGKGERIYSVRFLDDVGYVVTFRQTDPLYVVDLRDPERPAVTGELKVPGFSSYLHPLGDGLLLGVGQDATDDGRVQGSQVSLFDVSDPARPTRQAQLTFGPGRSPVEDDHRAFLWWAPAGLAVVPVDLWPPEGGPTFSGAIGVRAGRDGGLAEVGRVVHDGRGSPVAGREPWGAGVRRALVVGDALYTLSDRGLMASDLDDLQPRAFLAWA